MAFCADSQYIAVQIELDVLLIEAGKICFKKVAVSEIGNVGLEFSYVFAVEKLTEGLGE